MRGMARRLPVLLGAICGYVLYLISANGFGLGKAIDFSCVAAAPLFGWPKFTHPVFTASAVRLIAPVAIVLVAENLGHVKAIAAMTGRDFDPLLGRAFLADGLATVIAGSGGGTGVTNYAENMGVMAVTRVFSTLVFVVAGIVALLLDFSPKFGALIMTLPGPVIGGLALVVFGLIAATAGRIWVGNRVDFSDPRNLTAAFALTAGGGRSYCKLVNLPSAASAPRPSARSSSTIFCAREGVPTTCP
jgi:putative pyrimidine permease RutG